MGGVNHGPDIEFAKRVSDMERQIGDLTTRDVLQNASIGQSGLTIEDGGSITVEGGGSITVEGGGSIVVQTGGSISLPTGTLAAASLSIGGSGSIGGTLFVDTLAATNDIQTSSGDITATVGTVAAGGNVTAGGQVISTGIINSPGTKANTVTVGYSAVYIDSSGNMGGNTSSRRFKTNITPHEYDLDGLLDLGQYRFQRHADFLEMGEGAPWQAGLLAEEVEPIAPEHVWHDEDGRVEGIRYEELVVPLIQAVKRERAQRLAMQSYYDARLEALEAVAGITPPPLPPTL